MQSEFDQVLSASNITRVTVILVYTRALTIKGMMHKFYTPPCVDNNLIRYKTVVRLCAEVPHKFPEGRRAKAIKL